MDITCFDHDYTGPAPCLQCEVNSSDNVVGIGEEPVRAFPIEGEVADKVKDLIDEYADEISLVSAAGILFTVAHELIEMTKADMDG
jgi:hypothetical protein|tara:strand:+ start:283 stop:540 length:258 start_codon:yes stop_codon:yes gene_type:complete